MWFDIEFEHKGEENSVSGKCKHWCDQRRKRGAVYS